MPAKRTRNEHVRKSIRFAQHPNECTLRTLSRGRAHNRRSSTENFFFTDIIFIARFDSNRFETKRFIVIGDFHNDTSDFALAVCLVEPDTERDSVTNERTVLIFFEGSVGSTFSVFASKLLFEKWTAAIFSHQMGVTFRRLDGIVTNLLNIRRLEETNTIHGFLGLGTSKATKKATNKGIHLCYRNRDKVFV